MLTWKTRIDDLRACGMTLAEIGEHIGLSTMAVCDLGNGHTKSPRGDAALKLHALHAERCAKRSKAPA